jgi:hypothetical protein
MNRQDAADAKLTEPEFLNRQDAADAKQPELIL